MLDTLFYSMFLRRKKFIFSLIIFLLLVVYQRLTPAEQVLSEQISISPTIKLEQSIKQEAQVLRVIDGDTIEVLLNGEKEKVRVIGINTPEVVDLPAGRQVPRKKVECFGREASNMAKEVLDKQTVSLESDFSQKERDNYDRLLRYVLINNIDFGKFMIENGYAYEYTYNLPYKYQIEYKEAENQAREGKLGLWKSASCVKKSS